MGTRTISVSRKRPNENLVSVQVIKAVAEQTDTDPLDLPPLYEAVDPDVLNVVFEPFHGGGPLGTTLAFTYVGHEVTIAYDGEVVITVEDTATMHDRL